MEAGSEDVPWEEVLANGDLFTGFFSLLKSLPEQNKAWLWLAVGFGNL